MRGGAEGGTGAAIAIRNVLKTWHSWYHAIYNVTALAVPDASGQHDATNASCKTSTDNNLSQCVSLKTLSFRSDI